MKNTMVRTTAAQNIKSKPKIKVTMLNSSASIYVFFDNLNLFHLSSDGFNFVYLLVYRTDFIF